MSDVVGIRVKCPECGATMRSNADIVTCSYCGTECRVQRRTQVLQRPVVLPPLGPMQPYRIAVQRTNPIGWIIFGAIVVGFGIAGIVSHQQVEATRAQNVPQPYTEMWDTSHPLLVDLDHDGIEDAIGLARYMGDRDELHVRAVAGASGKTLWESPSLGKYLDTYRSELVLAGGLVLFADLERTPRLDAYELATGVKRWSVVPVEVVQSLCRDRDGTALLVTKDEVAVSLDLTTGATTPRPKQPKCDPLPNTSWTRSVLIDTNNKHWRFAPPGMQSDRITGDVSSWIITGYKSPGTAIPMIAVIDDHERVIWKSQLASTDPMSSKSPVNQQVAYDATMIATAFVRSDDNRPPVLVAFDRARGTRLFETELETKAVMIVTDIDLDLGATTIWVQLDTGLQAYDRKTGKLRWRLGR